MKQKTIYIIFLCLVSLGAIISFVVDKGVLRYYWGIIAILGWLLLAMIRSEAVEVSDISEEEERIQEKSEDIPGYTKSGLDIRGCYNCAYSKDIGNDTYVMCRYFKCKVFRNYVCDKYKV